MRDILTEIVAHKGLEVGLERSVTPLKEIIAIARDMPAVHSMSRSIATSESGIIAEFKRRSPSKGWLNASADSAVIPSAYSEAGAAALSILTNKTYFGGSIEDIVRARPTTTTPILCKEFIIDEYQIYQARAVGADAVLLIAAALPKERCAQLAELAASIGLEVLLELHTPSEVEYITDSVAMVGVNNRNLGSFHTDIANSFKMVEYLPSDKILVSESGISSPESIIALREVGYRGFLIGESFIKEENPALALSNFIAEIK